MGYYIPKSDVEGFDPDTYFEGPILDANGICHDAKCQELGYCRLKGNPKMPKRVKKNEKQLSFDF